MLDYLLTLAWLRILDALAGPEPETPADQQREPDRERLEKAFPEIERSSRKTGAAVVHRADHLHPDD